MGHRYSGLRKVVVLRLLAIGVRTNGDRDSVKLEGIQLSLFACNCEIHASQILLIGKATSKYHK